MTMVGVFPSKRMFLHKKITHFPQERNFIVWECEINMVAMTSCENVLDVHYITVFMIPSQPATCIYTAI